MSLVASDSGGGDFEPVPKGTHNAVCYKLVDAGTSMHDAFGSPKGSRDEKKHTIYIFWELPDCRLEKDGRPMSINAEYTLSLGTKAKLRQILEAWRNESFNDEELAGFDLTKILGVTCKLEVGHTSGGNAKVVKVFCADGGPKRVETQNEQVVFDLEDYCKEFAGKSTKASKKACDVLEELPWWMQHQIAGCDEPGRDQVPPCFEVQAVKEKGGSSPVVQQPPAPDDDDDFEDDVPF